MKEIEDEYEKIKKENGNTKEKKRKYKKDFL